MKFSKNNYESLKESVSHAVNNTGKDINTLVRESELKQESEQRFLWDLYWLSKWAENNRHTAAYYLDSHIESALRKVVHELQKYNYVIL